jgi:hypothetical protein
MHESYDRGRRTIIEYPPARGVVAMRANPLEANPEREARIRERAYRMWEENGRPHGRDVEFWERARELVGMEESRGAGQIAPSSNPSPGVDEAELQEKLGEFPGQTDQGEKQKTPRSRRKRRG